MLEFWGTWCGPCKTDHPELRYWNDRFEKRNISLVGIAMDSYADRVSNYKEEASLE
ncbi:MAG: TlpA family protein disulfide reductase [Saprospiraceae bacterium]|nr:TlpA family protein disulfide reductase [Saprospiraceae bacterium]